MEYHIESNHEYLLQIGSRIKRERLLANMNQAQLAEHMGVAIKTVQNLENGRNPTLETLISAMRSLGLIHHFDQFLPEPGPSPIELAQHAGKQRQRARASRVQEPNHGEWKW